MLARRRLRLLRPRPLQLGAGQRRLRGQQHGFGGCPSLQALACGRHGAPALGDVLRRDHLLLLRGYHGQIAARGFGQQIQARGLAFHRQRVDAGIGQRAARVQLAAALQHAGQGQGGLGLAEGARISAAQRVLDVQPRAQGRAQRRGVEIRLQSASAGIDQAQVGMGTGHARDGIVEREDIRGNNGRWRLRVHARRDREGGQCRQSQPHGESPGSR